MTEKQKLGEQIRSLREKISSVDYENEHISQQELADKNIGLTKNYIGTMERGQANPTLEKFILLAKALNYKSLKIFDVEIDIEKFIKENWEQKEQH